ncbi:MULTISPECIES: ArnT family glycosyltransferase [Rhizobium/Agrobacterium group]|uniref:ArnT family glycosyltransferase n=1 Tax=Rhizobium/Agrobacterium group TaxID=227290 RepID=UPI0003F1D9B3|nr:MULTISPECIES: glycosyltransferase family 39 protein [Rhizobium/Agrobacterium group]AHK04341.1 hypothetical protein X971_4497 [Agrobacterium tumefaciens LBA4213 (Ach5)]AKC10082.1 hypothetical protein Ach5_43090 [Agrobacterium tumefaciens]AYM19226.1 hypothetical protein At15955_42410 [Agrobacterium tumefaciens]AYM70527.1 hypothetical protein AtA6_43110 [Agrobacterium tumefaciens]NIB57195.1 hypothetical protein [Agrobacterium tumefaciens]
MLTKENNSRDYAIFGAIILCALFAAVSVRWVMFYRTGGGLDIDEAGYIGYSIALERALIGGGIVGWLHAFFTPTGQAPLTMVVASFITTEAGTYSEWIALTTNSFILFFLLFMVYLLAAREYGRSVGFFSLIIVATTPYVIDFSRLFNFGIPTALFFIATIYCYRRSEGMAKLGWVAAVGCCAALMVLSRTMALAFLPAFALVFLVEGLFWRTHIKTLVLSILVGTATFAMVCGPWFAVNFHIVFEYLFSFGYGRKAAEYGAGEGIFSYDDIKFRLYLFTKYTKLTHIIFFLIGLCAIAISLVISKNERKKGLSFSAHVLLLTSLCLLTLMSSRNIGTAFDLPLLPPLVVAMAGSLANIIRTTRIRYLAASIALLCVTPVYFLHADQRLCEAYETGFSASGVDIGPVAFCGGIMENYIGDRYGRGNNGDQIRSIGAAWMNTSSELSRALTELPGSEFGVVFASRHILANVNSVNLARIQTVGSFLPLQQIDPTAVTDDVAHYGIWLTSAPVSSACYVVMLNSIEGEFPFPANPENLRAALSQNHYSVVATIDTPTHGQFFDIFRKPAAECGKGLQENATGSLSLEKKAALFDDERNRSGFLVGGEFASRE